MKAALSALALGAALMSTPVAAQEGGASPELCTVVLANAYSMMTAENEKRLVSMFQSYYAGKAVAGSTATNAMMTVLGKGAEQVGSMTNEKLGETTKNCMAGQAKEDVQVLFMLDESMKEKK
jgi:hypothetical protein